MGDIMMGLGTAMNNHDLDAFVALFADDYQSEQPAHPTRSFQGADKVRENWESVFAGIPNLRAELLTSATTRDGVEVGEWGHRRNGRCRQPVTSAIAKHRLQERPHTLRPSR